jgi:glycosidase
MPDLNYSNKDVWSAVDDVADYWLDNGIDGFRLDAAMHIDDSVNANYVHSDSKEGTVTHEWWQHFEQHVKEKNPSAFCVGEVWAEENMQSTQARFFGDLDSDFDFYLMSEIKSMVKGTKKSIAKFAQSYTEQIMEQAQSTDVDKVTINSTMLDNHDVNRLAYDLNGNTDQLKLAAAIQMTLPGMPWIYYGDELGQQGGGSDSSSDPNRREAMDWYKDRDGEGATYMNKVRSWGSSEKFTKANDGISVEEQDGVSDSLLEYYRTLTSIRNQYKIFYTGEYGNPRYFGNAYSYTVTDDSRGYSMLVLHNNKADSSIVANAEFTDLISGQHYNAGDTVTINNCQSMIIKLNDGQVNPFL